MADHEIRRTFASEAAACKTPNVYFANTTHPSEIIDYYKTKFPAETSDPSRLKVGVTLIAGSSTYAFASSFTVFLPPIDSSLYCPVLDENKHLEPYIDYPAALEAARLITVELQRWGVRNICIYGERDNSYRFYPHSYYILQHAHEGDSCHLMDCRCVICQGLAPKPCLCDFLECPVTKIEGGWPGPAAIGSGEDAEGE